MGAQCSIDGCSSAVLSRGWCQKHYDWHRNRGLLHLGELKPIIRRGCSVEGCDRDHMSKGYCKTHYAQHARGETPGVIRFHPGQNAVRDELGRKQCGKCREWKTEDEYHKNVATFDGLAYRCMRCISEYAKERAYSLRTHRHSISQEQIEELMRSQAFKCAICGVCDVNLHIDHDHVCCPNGNKSCGQCIRGMLCPFCNKMLGHARDSPEILSSAIEYLNQWAELRPDLVK